MRLSTSNFSVKVAAFAAVIAVSLAAMEWYARTSSAFASGEQWMIGKYTTSDPSNAVFGDSQIGGSNRIDGFEFFGWAGTEPDELERLVKYIYTFKKPKRVIFELAPQLFSDYEGREEFVTWKNLPFRYLPLLISSPYFYEDMKRALGLDTKGLIGRIVTSAHASTLTPPDKEASANSQGRWAAAVDKVGGGYNFNWDTLGVDDRHLLSLSRVFSQNPIDGFATSEKAKSYEVALQYLIDKGADICLYRPPVTPELEKLQFEIPSSNYRAFEEYAEKLAHTKKLRFISYKDLGLQFDNSMFFNQDHMNSKGLNATWPKVKEACFPTG